MLITALESLCLQTIDVSVYEVIIVDNNSTDGTHKVAQKFCLDHPNFTYCVELCQGLSHARNRGLEVARGDYIAYIDDDCRLPRQYLEVAAEVIESLSPAVFGGPYSAFYNSAKPLWFKDSYGSHLQGTEARILGPTEFLDGGNLIIQRSLAQKLSGFDPNLGMSGNRIAYGEETDLILRIRKSMPQAMIYYDPRLLVHHLVASWKMTIRGAARRHFADGRFAYRVFSDGRVAVGGHLWLIAETLGAMILFCADAVWAVTVRNRRRYPYLQNYLYEHSFRYIRSLGVCYERIMGWNRDRQQIS
jgi:glucosyl-dolichyl phosphate glucuronosyltransferase